MDSLRWQNWTVLSLGAYIYSTPRTLASLLDYSATTSILIEQCVAGGLIMAVAYLGLLYPKAWHEAVKVSTGMWLIVSLWALGFSDTHLFTYNDVFCGLVLMFFGGLALIARHPGRRRQSL